MPSMSPSRPSIDCRGRSPALHTDPLEMISHTPEAQELRKKGSKASARPYVATCDRTVAHAAELHSSGNIGG